VPKITDIKQQKKEGRFNIYLDEKFSFALPAETLVKAGLSIGQKLSKDEIQALKHKEAVEKSYNQVLRFLSYRPRSKKEVNDYLLKKNEANDKDRVEIIALTIAKLESLGLVDDKEFAKWWWDQRKQFRPKGIYALKQELYRKGISQDIIAQLLSSSTARQTEMEGAKKAVWKKIRSLESFTPREIRKKLTSFLIYRGFSYETIKLVLDETLGKR